LRFLYGLEHCSGSSLRRLRASHEADTPWSEGLLQPFVQPEHLADRFKDAILPPVFATPVMIMVMENAALNAIRAYLDPGESAVGTAVNVRHLAATRVGRLVTGGGRGDESRRAADRAHRSGNRGRQGDRGRLAFQGRHRRG
jgi:hypothetical protein